MDNFSLLWCLTGFSLAGGVIGYWFRSEKPMHPDFGKKTERRYQEIKYDLDMAFERITNLNTYEMPKSNVVKIKKASKRIVPKPSQIDAVIASYYANDPNFDKKLNKLIGYDPLEEQIAEVKALFDI